MSDDKNLIYNIRTKLKLPKEASSRVLSEKKKEIAEAAKISGMKISHAKPSVGDYRHYNNTVEYHHQKVSPEVTKEYVTHMKASYPDHKVHVSKENKLEPIYNNNFRSMKEHEHPYWNKKD